MKEILLETPNVVEKGEKRLRRWTLVLYFSVAAGIVFALSGLVLGAVSYLGVFAADADALNQIGNLLIIAAFVLLMLGAR